MKNTYSEKYRDPRWQRKRLEIMERDRFACVDCGDDESTLNVHHSYYVAKRMPWEYPDWAMETLCEKCHVKRHAEELQPWENHIETLGGLDEIAEAYSFYAEFNLARSMTAIQKETCLKILRGAFDFFVQAIDGGIVLSDLKMFIEIAKTVFSIDPGHPLAGMDFPQRKEFLLAHVAKAMDEHRENSKKQE